MNQSATFANHADIAAELGAKKATARLRRHAYRSGWPINLSRKLEIKHENGEFFVNFPEELMDEYLDTEYGTQDNPPNPVMHRFINRIDEQMDEYDAQLSQIIDRLDIF